MWIDGSMHCNWTDRGGKALPRLVKPVTENGVCDSSEKGVCFWHQLHPLCAELGTHWASLQAPGNFRHSWLLEKKHLYCEKQNGMAVRNSYYSGNALFSGLVMERMPGFISIIITGFMVEWGL